MVSDSPLSLVIRGPKPWGTTHLTKVTLDHIELCDDCPNGEAFVLTVTSPTGKSFITIKDGTTLVDSIYFVNPTRIVVVGEYNSIVKIVTLIDLKKPRTIGYLMTYVLAISDDRRYVAYLRFFPRISRLPETSSVYLVVDMANLKPTSSSEELAGWPIYPMENVHAQTTRPMVTGKDYHLIWGHAFQWKNNHTVTFVDYWRKQFNRVTVDLSAGVDHPRISEARNRH
jgi:hypothetical protein